MHYLRGQPGEYCPGGTVWYNYAGQMTIIMVSRGPGEQFTVPSKSMQ